MEHLHRLGPEFVQDHLDRFSPSFRFTMTMALDISVDEYLAARRRRFDHVLDLDLLLGDDAVLLTPTMCVEGFGPEGTGPEQREEADAYNTGETNITGHPSLSVPAGVCTNGIPFGLQITGPRFRDDLVLNVAEAWETCQPLAAHGARLRAVRRLTTVRRPGPFERRARAHGPRLYPSRRGRWATKSTIGLGSSPRSSS